MTTTREAALEAALNDCIAAIERADMADGVCCCGDNMENHSEPMNCGHSPVDAGEYHAHQVLTAAHAALSTPATEPQGYVEGLEAAASKLQNVADNWDCGHNESRLCDCAPYVEQWGLAADEIRAMITPDQLTAIAAHVAAEGAKAWAEDAVKMAFPADVLEFVLKIGRAEWGQTDPKTAAEHAADMATTVEKTAAHFGQTEPQSLNGLYIEGTGIVICHTGVSPNSPEIARILTGLWNMIYDAAQIGAKP